MLSFNFICIFILFGITTIFLLIFLLLKLFDFLFPKNSYYQQQKSFHESENNPYIHINKGDRNKKNIDYSIIYTIDRHIGDKIEKAAIKHQIECLYLLMKENFGENVEFEIVCIIDPSNYPFFRYISSLYQNHRYINPVLKSTEGIRYLINGFVYSRGNVIVDSQFISDEIIQMKEINAKSLVVELYKPNLNSFIRPENFSYPILFTKVAGEVIFQNLHVTKFGFSHELLYVCDKLKIETRYKKQEIGKFDLSIISIVKAIFFRMIVDIGYNSMRWTLTSNF